MKTLIGLYKDVATATRVAQEIVAYGIEQDDISLADRRTQGDEVDEGRDTPNPSKITDTSLTEKGVGYSVGGMQPNGTLLTVRMTDNQVNDVVDIMNQNEPIDVHVDDTTSEQAGAGMSPEEIRANMQRTAAQPGATSRTDYDRDGKQSFYTDGSQDEKERKSMEKRSPLNTRTNVGEQPGEYNEELRPLSHDSTEVG